MVEWKQQEGESKYGNSVYGDNKGGDMTESEKLQCIIYKDKSGQ